MSIIRPTRRRLLFAAVALLLLLLGLAAVLCWREPANDEPAHAYSGDESPPLSTGGITAFDLETGARLWTHDPGWLRRVDIELYSDGLVVRDQSFRGAMAAISLDSTSGAVVPPFASDVARRSGQTATCGFPIAGEDRNDSSESSGRAATLANGWRPSPPVPLAEPIAAGPMTPVEVDFVDAEGERVWTLRLIDAPLGIVLDADLVLVVGSRSGGDGLGSLAAFGAGERRPRWSIDFARLDVRDLKDLCVVPHGERVYVVAGLGVAALERASGEVLFARTLDEELRVAAAEEPVDTEIHSVEVLESGAVVIVRRGALLVALARASGETRWQVLGGNTLTSLCADATRLYALADRGVRTRRSTPPR